MHARAERERRGAWRVHRVALCIAALGAMACDGGGAVSDGGRDAAMSDAAPVDAAGADAAPNDASPTDAGIEPRLVRSTDFAEAAGDVDGVPNDARVRDDARRENVLAQIAVP